MLKLSLIEGDQLIENIVQETNTDPAELCQALNNFRERINTLFTKKIIEHSQSSLLDPSDQSSEDEDISPKKQRR